MGTSQSTHQLDHSDEESESEHGNPIEDDDRFEEEEEEVDQSDEDVRRIPNKPTPTKILLQEPEILTCYASASPISPQLSTVGTPRVKVWDPCNVLSPPLPQTQSRSFVSGDGFGQGGDRVTEVFLVAHGECGVAMRPDLVGGRCPGATMTANGERQARAMSVFLNSQGVRFSSVYCSPLDRARATAGFVCRELGFAEEQIQSSDSLTEISNGQWEGCRLSEIHTPEMVNVIDKTQPDFSAPSGESLRQVEFRMIEFLNRTVIKMPEKLSTVSMLLHQNERKGFSRQSSTDSVHEQNGHILPHYDLLHRHNKQGLSRKKSGKSRLQFVTTGDHEIEDELSPRESDQFREVNTRTPSSSVGIFTHATPIKCLITGLIECSPAMATKICIDDSSMTVLEHSLRTGWQIRKLNDTAHLRLLRSEVIASQLEIAGLMSKKKKVSPVVRRCFMVLEKNRTFDLFL